MSITVAVITHDRLSKLEHILYVISEQTVQPDKVEVYYSGYVDEFVYRFNSREGELCDVFADIVGRVSTTGKLPYKTLKTA